MRLFWSSCKCAVVHEFFLSICRTPMDCERRNDQSDVELRNENNLLFISEKMFYVHRESVVMSTSCYVYNKLCLERSTGERLSCRSSLFFIRGMNEDHIHICHMCVCNVWRQKELLDLRHHLRLRLSIIFFVCHVITAKKRKDGGRRYESLASR